MISDSHLKVFRFKHHSYISSSILPEEINNKKDFLELKSINQARGSSVNSVVKFLGIFDPPLLRGHFY